MRATSEGFNLFSPSALMAAVEPDAVLCRGLGGLPRSTSTTRRVYQGLGDPASHPLPASPIPTIACHDCRNCRESPGFACSFLHVRKFCVNAKACTPSSLSLSLLLTKMAYRFGILHYVIAFLRTYLDAWSFGIFNRYISEYHAIWDPEYKL